LISACQQPKLFKSEPSCSEDLSSEPFTAERVRMRFARIVARAGFSSSLLDALFKDG
jgi:hypothetical protein